MSTCSLPDGSTAASSARVDSAAVALQLQHARFHDLTAPRWLQNAAALRCPCFVLAVAPHAGGDCRFWRCLRTSTRRWRVGCTWT